VLWRHSDHCLGADVLTVRCFWAQVYEDSRATYSFCIRSADPITSQCTEAGEQLTKIRTRTVGAMKSLQPLLFGLVAGLLATGAASAAELQAKGKPAGHAKNCSAFGAGFQYVPGADLCMKIGGWARAEAGSGSVNWGALNGNPGDRAGANDAMRARGYITTDVRKQTEYGTVRAYVSVGATNATNQ
jgi:hypothetical protein